MKYLNEAKTKVELEYIKSIDNYISWLQLQSEYIFIVYNEDSHCLYAPLIDSQLQLAYAELKQYCEYVYDHNEYTIITIDSVVMASTFNR